MPAAPPVELRTGRLVLRPFRDSDLAPFAALNADPVVMEHFPALLSRAESDALAQRIGAHLEQHGFTFWAVEVPGVSSFVGMTGLARTPFEAPFTPCIEIGWRLAREHWGKGYAQEAARASLQFAFEQLASHEVVSFTAATNVRSQRVMQAIGMVRDTKGDFDHPQVANGDRLQRHVLYRIRSTPTPTEAAR